MFSWISPLLHIITLCSEKNMQNKKSLLNDVFCFTEQNQCTESRVVSRLEWCSRKRRVSWVSNIPFPSLPATQYMGSLRGLECALLQTQGSNLSLSCLLQWQACSFPLAPSGKPFLLCEEGLTRMDRGQLSGATGASHRLGNRKKLCIKQGCLSK